jgi:hypothetical protein
MEYLLLVTSFLGGNSTTSYQVAFASRQACEIALSELRNDARRLAASGDTVRTQRRRPRGERREATARPPRSCPPSASISVEQGARFS